MQECLILLLGMSANGLVISQTAMQDFQGLPSATITGDVQSYRVSYYKGFQADVPMAASQR